MLKPMAFLFGGAWGNADLVLAARWFAHLSRRRAAQGWQPVVVPYTGVTFGEVVSDAERFVRQHRNGSPCIAVAYSMGGNVVHAVAEHGPDLFSEVVFMSCPEPEGFDWQSFLWAFRILWAPFLLSVFTLGLVPIHLAPWGRAQRFFLNRDGFPDPDLQRFMENHLLWVHPQEFWPATQVALPLLRRRCKGLSVPCIYVVPEWDRVARIPHERACLQGNLVMNLTGPWGHGAILQERAVEQMWVMVGPRLVRHLIHL